MYVYTRLYQYTTKILGNPGIHKSIIPEKDTLDIYYILYMYLIYNVFIKLSIKYFKFEILKISIECKSILL